MPPSSAPDNVYCTRDDLESLLSPAGTVARVDDDDNAAVSTAEAAHITNAIRWASAKIDFYLLGRYDGD